MQFPNVIGGLKLFWDRVTFSRLTKFYFAFSVLHCIIQVIFQVQAYVANAEAASFLDSLIHQGNASDPGFTVYEGDLRMCETVPKSVDASSCTVVWDGHTRGNVTFDTQGQTYAAVNASLPLSPALPSSSTSAVSGFSTASSSSIAAAVSAAPSLSFTTLSPPPVQSTLGAPSSSVASSSLSTASVSGTAPVTVTSAATRTITVITSSTSAPQNNVATGSDSDDESDENDDGSDDELDLDGSTLIVIHDHDKRGVVLPETQMRLALQGYSTVNLDGLYGIQDIGMPRKCLYALNWPCDIVENTKREDIAFIAFQFWLLGMSLVALLNESIPHIVASLLTHILATAWGGFQMANTENFHRKFTMLTTQGACGINLLPDYWKSRSNAEIPSLALNAFALLVSAFLSWRLMKTFGWQTFKRVGASRTINKVYNLVLMFSIAVQLSLFFVGASAALWIDQVYHGNIGRLTHDPKLFTGLMLVVLIILIPWLATGWISVRQEYRKRMLVFLGIALYVIGGWAAMFVAATFRWTYATWLFFSLMTTTAVLLALTTFILGIVCRLNFGKGLKRYLHAQEELVDEDEKTYDSEKIAFPSTDSPIPTFSVSFGSGPDVPPPSQMKFGATRGPRFYSGSSAASNPFETPFETPPGSVRGAGSPPGGSPTDYGYGYGHGGYGGSVGTVRGAALSRQGSHSSQMSQSSTHSAGSTASKGSASRRWVIE